MAEISGGLLVGHALRNQGVERIFTLCGAHIMPVYYGCKEVGIDIIDFRHEAAAGFAAIAYAQTTGNPGVVLTTAGPGVLNMTTAMVEAREQEAPVVHLGGAAALDRIDTHQMQETNTLEIMSQCSVWSRRVHETRRLGEYVQEAFRNAVCNIPGPTYLELPADVLSAACDEKWLSRLGLAQKVAPPSVDRAAISDIADALVSASRPMVIIGDGARYLDSELDSVLELIRYLQLPTHTVGLARGLLAGEDAEPLLMSRASAAAKSDFVITLQNRPDFRTAFLSIAQKNGATLISCHTDPSMHQPPMNEYDRAVTGTPGAFCRQLLSELKERKEPVNGGKWAEEAAALSSAEKRPWVEGFESERLPMHPGRCAFEVARFLERDAPDYTVVADGGDAYLWIREAAVARHKGQMLGWGPNGTIGTGLGFSIGAWFGREKPVLLYTGDGSFGFYAMELDTVARFQIPLIVVIANDSAWGVIRATENLIRTVEVDSHGDLGTGLTHMLPYEQLADIWGFMRVSVKTPGELQEALAEAVSAGRPAVINVEINKVDTSPIIAAYGASVKSSR